VTTTNGPSTSGAARILLYNWPVYAGTWAGAAIAVALATRASGLVALALALGALFAVAWSCGALAVS
jgi:hypothetical protein